MLVREFTEEQRKLWMQLVKKLQNWDVVYNSAGRKNMFSKILPPGESLEEYFGVGSILLAADSSP